MTPSPGRRLSAQVRAAVNATRDVKVGVGTGRAPLRCHKKSPHVETSQTAKVKFGAWEDSETQHKKGRKMSELSYS